MLAAIATFFVAALHVLFMVFETFLWTTPSVRKRFGQTAEQAETTRCSPPTRASTTGRSRAR
jgi:putative membrane protein